MGVVTHCTYTTYFSWSIRSHVIMLEHVRERRSSLGLPFPLFFLFTSYLTTTYPTGLKNHSYQSEIKSVEKRKYLLYFLVWISVLIGTLKITLHTFRNGIVQYWPWWRFILDENLTKRSHLNFYAKNCFVLFLRLFTFFSCLFIFLSHLFTFSAICLYFSAICLHFLAICLHF